MYFGMFISYLCAHLVLLCYTSIKDTMMLGADYYETEAEVAAQLAEGRVPIGIGENTKIK